MASAQKLWLAASSGATTAQASGSAWPSGGLVGNTAFVRVTALNNLTMGELALRRRGTEPASKCLHDSPVLAEVNFSEETTKEVPTRSQALGADATWAEQAGLLQAVAAAPP